VVGVWTDAAVFIIVCPGATRVTRIDWSNLRESLRHGITRRSGAFFALDARRLRALLGAALLFVYGRISFVLFAAMDRVFFPRFRRVVVRRPLFVVGNFRSGTSLVFNMLSAGNRSVTAFRTWQIYLAPTISQRKLVRFLAMIDRRVLGRKGERALRAFNDRHLRTVPVHPIDLFLPEEDAGLLMYTWTGFFTWFLFPRRDRESRFVRFDDLPRRYRSWVVRFYQTMVQRHLYDESRGGLKPVPVFVSKNPTFTGMIRTIREAFPDSRFLYMMRGPDETYRSTMDWFGFWAWRVGDRSGKVDPDRVRAMMSHWYRYPPRVFETMNTGDWAIVTLERLIASPDRMLRQLGSRLALDWLVYSENRRHALAAMRRNYGSRHSEPQLRHINRFVSRLVARESAAITIRRFDTDLRLGIALALRIE